MPDPEPTLARMILKGFGVFLGALVGLVVLASLLLLTLLEPMAERFLKKQVAENSAGLYSLDFADMDLELLTGTLVLENLRLSPDSAVHRQQRENGQASPQLWDIRAPRATIAGANWFRTILSGQLRIGKVAVDEPTITLLTDEKAAKNPQGKTTRNGREALVKSVRIREIHVPNATYRYRLWDAPDPPGPEISQATLHITGFRMDDLHQPGGAPRPQADDVRLEVRDLAFRTADSLYAVHVGHLQYSSREKDFLAEAIRVRSEDGEGASQPSRTNPPIFEVTVPRFRVSGFDALEAYRNQHLRIKEIWLQNPDLKITQNPSVSPDSASLDLAAVYRSVSGYLRVVEVEAFRVTGASFILQNRGGNDWPVHEVRKATVALRGICLDSAVMAAPLQNLFATELLASAREYTYQSAQNPHTVKLAHLTLSTRHRYLQADSLRILGDADRNTLLRQAGKAQTAVINLDVPFLRISNLDVVRALKTSHLAIGRILVQRPTLRVLHDRNVPKGDTGADLRSVSKAMSGFIARVGVGEMRLEDGTFVQHDTKEIPGRQTHRLEHTSVVATGLRLDSTFFQNPAARLPLAEVVVEATRYTYWMPDQPYTFHLGSLRYSTRSQDLTARSIHVYPDAEANKLLQQSNAVLYGLSANRFTVTGLDAVRAFNAGRLEVGDVVLGQPALDILHVRPEAPPAGRDGQAAGIAQVLAVMNPIRARSIRLEDGTITYREQHAEIIRTHVLNHASATVIGLHLSPHTLSRENAGSLPLQELSLTAQDYTYQSPDRLYTTTLGSVHYSSREQALTARAIGVTTDKQEHERLKRETPHLANRNLFDVTAQKFQITGLNLIRAFGTGQFMMGEMVLSQPEVAILQDHQVPVGPEEQDQTDSDLTKQLGELVDVFRVGRLRLDDGLFTVTIRQDSGSSSQRVEHVSVALENLRLVTLEATELLEMFAVSDMELAVRDYSFLTPDSLYRFEVGQIRSSLRDQTLSIDSLRLIPLFTEAEFSERVPYAQDRFDLQVPRINLRGINVQALLNRQELIVRKALIDGLDLNIYRDNRLPLDPDRRPPTLQRLLREVDAYLRLDTVSLVDGRFAYTERPPKGPEPGVLTMEELNFDLTNVTNDSMLIQQNPIASLVASTQIMGAGTLDVAFRLHLNHPEDLYTYTGTVAPMDFMAFNPLFEKVTAIRIVSGQINQVTFAVEATEHRATGHMTFLYEDFHIRLLNADDPANPGLWRRVGSWLADKVVIKTNNPSGKRAPRVGPIDVERDYQRSVFNHMSKAMMDGMSSNFMAPPVKRIVNALSGGN